MSVLTLRDRVDGHGSAARLGDGDARLEGEARLGRADRLVAESAGSSVGGFLVLERLGQVLLGVEVRDGKDQADPGGSGGRVCLSLSERCQESVEREFWRTHCSLPNVRVRTISSEPSSSTTCTAGIVSPLFVGS
jgi:hypothetical protein